MSKKIAVNHHVSAPILASLVFSVSYISLEQDFVFSLYLRGLFSSITFGLFFSTLTFLFSRAHAWIPNLFLVLFLVFDSIHIVVNNSHINLQFYHFIFKSSFADSIFNQSFLTTLLYVVTAWICSLWLSRLKTIRSNFKVWLPLALLTLLLDLFLPIDISSSNWSQQNFIVSNVQNLRTSSLLSQKREIEPGQNLFSKDLSGKKFLPPGKKQKPHIVLLILEGFSQMYVEMGLTPQIKKIQEEGITVRNFITNQLQTNRGLYALMCADYPNLVAYEAKSDFLASGLLNSQCLPHALTKLGYENYFLQSAFLSFMRKDLFAKNSGYDFAVGADSFKREQVISSWGIPDNLLAESVYKVLVEKKELDRPKFISALTSGTHHPFITPMSKGDLSSAVQYTDVVVGKLYEALKEKGLLENTLFIITSDESKTLSPRFPDIYSNWGLLTMVGAGLKKQNIEKTFSQVDLSNSILDFLDVAEDFSFSGRSIFRRYKESQNIFMGNTYSKKIYMTLDKSSYLLCDYFLNCKVKTGKKDLFSDSYTKRSATQEEIKKLSSFVIQNDLTFSKAKQSVLFQEQDILVSKEKPYAFIQEFKTTPLVNSALKYKVQKDNEVPIKAEYSFYKCGDPSTLQKRTKLISSNIETFSLHIPSEMLEENLCHSLYLFNTSDRKVSIKQVQLFQ